MSRSRKKSPIQGVTAAASEKADKRATNRKVRRGVRAKLAVDADAELLPHPRDVSNPWNMAKEGKIYVGKDPRPKDLRK
ncbi:MAG TPA: hypothetical protein VLT17_10435 [Gemmatimonadales bacterium]|jgi:hypothetical protein|nr:hypothetical protein [Gemmatimonadales bacterium]